VRFGKVKIPSNLFNEIQDIDPSYMWALLPQGVYTLPEPQFASFPYGGVAYGTFKLGQTLGQAGLSGLGRGADVIAADDGYWVSLREAGMNLPNGLSGPNFGGALHWKTPLTGLMIGGSDIRKPAWSSEL
jgi:hypothetical protein